MNNDIDLNIQNYELDDFLRLFKINSTIGYQDMHRVKKVIKTIHNSEMKIEIKKVFVQSYILIDGVKNYRTYISITNPEKQYTERDDIYIIETLRNNNHFPLWEMEISKDPAYKLDTLTLIRQILKPPPEKTKASPPINHPANPQMDATYVNEYSNKIVKGQINSIRRDIQLLNIHINSCFRENYYKTDPANYKYSLPDGNLQNILSMKLASIEIPNSIYLISEYKKNNKFVVIENGITTHEIVIPDGNYDRQNLQDIINLQLSIDIDILIDPITNKTTFNKDPISPSDFKLVFTDETTDTMVETLGWLLGFRLANYKINLGNKIISEALFNITPLKYLYLSVNEYQYNYNTTNIVCFDKMSITENILAKVTLVDSIYTITDDTISLKKIRTYNGPININKLEIKLLDMYGNIINLNHMDWSFSLELELLYENSIQKN